MTQSAIELRVVVTTTDGPCFVHTTLGEIEEHGIEGPVKDRLALVGLEWEMECQLVLIHRDWVKTWHYGDEFDVKELPVKSNE